MPSARTALSISAENPAPASSGMSSGSGSTVEASHGECPLGGGEVLLRQTVPGAKSHHGRVVEQEDGGAVGPRRLEDDVDRLGEQLVEGGGARDRVGDAVEGIDFRDPPAQLFALRHVS